MSGTGRITLPMSARALVLTMLSAVYLVISYYVHDFAQRPAYILLLPYLYALIVFGLLILAVSLARRPGRGNPTDAESDYRQQKALNITHNVQLAARNKSLKHVNYAKESLNELEKSIMVGEAKNDR